MLTALRSSVVDRLTALAAGDLDVWATIPDDVAALPCLVAGLPSATPADQNGVVFDRTLVVYVIGRRVDAGGNETELTDLADRLFDGFGGTRGVRLDDGSHVAVDSVVPRVVAVAGVDHDAYLLTLTSQIATC